MKFSIDGPPNSGKINRKDGVSQSVSSRKRSKKFILNRTKKPLTGQNSFEIRNFLTKTTPNRGPERGTQELKYSTKILTLQRDTSPGLSSFEVEGVADSVSSPRDLTFFRIASGSVRLLTF